MGAAGVYGKDDQTPDWGIRMNHNGTAAKPITLNSTVLHGAVIDAGNDTDRVVGINLDGSYNVVAGFEIRNGLDGGICVGDGSGVGGSHNTIHNNLIHDNGTTDTGSPDGQYGLFSYQTTQDNAYDANNIYHNGRTGSNLDHGMYLCGDNEIVTNNIVTGNATHGLQVAGYRTVVNMKIYNNVFANNGGNGITLWKLLRGVDIKNNIFYQNGRAGISSWAAFGGGVVVDHNLCYGNIQGDYNFTAGASHYRYTLGTTIDANPLFVNSTDFHLQQGSPAIDAGLTLSDVLDDYDGDPRPSGLRTISALTSSRNGRAWKPILRSRSRPQPGPTSVASGLASAQLGPAFTSTFSGTLNGIDAAHLLRHEPGQVTQLRSEGISKINSSWICSSILAAELLAPQAAVDGDHGQLDQVGRRALDDRVDGRPLGKVAVRPAASRTPWIARRRPRIVVT